MTKWINLNIDAGFRFTGKVNGAFMNQEGERKPTYYNPDYNPPEFFVSLMHWKVYSVSKTSL